MPRLPLTVALVVSLLTAAPLISSTSLAATTTTKVEMVSPVTSGGTLGPDYAIRHRYPNANCASGSPNVGKAYQCFTPASPEGLYDSCWVQTDHHYVLCLVAPWQRKVVRLHVTRGYGDSGGFLTVHQPWGVRIGSAVRCQVILGPVHVIDHKPRTYLCNHHAVLVGKVRHHGATWTAREYRRVHRRGRPSSYRSLGKVIASIVWFGAPSMKD